MLLKFNFKVILLKISLKEFKEHNKKKLIKRISSLDWKIFIIHSMDFKDNIIDEFAVQSKETSF